MRSMYSARPEGLAELRQFVEELKGRAAGSPEARGAARGKETIRTATKGDDDGQPGGALRDHGRRRREAEGLLLRPLRLEDRLEQPDELRDGRDRRRGRNQRR